MKKTTCLLAAIGLLFCLLAAPTGAAPAYNRALALRIRGDVDGNGTVTTTDARMILQYAAGKSMPDTFDRTAADYEYNGRADTTDARLTLQYAAGKQETLPRPMPTEVGWFGEKKIDGESVPCVIGETIPNNMLRYFSLEYNAYNSDPTDVFAAQTPEEWAILKALAGFTVDYDEAFFADWMLVVASVYLGSTNSTYTAEGLIRGNGVLQVIGTCHHPSPDDQSVARGYAVIEVSRQETEGVTALSIHEESVTDFHW